MDKYGKKDMIVDVAEKCGMTQAQVKKVYEEIVNQIVTQATAGKSVLVRGLGTIKVKPLKARTVTSFGKKVDVPARKRISLVAKTF